MGHRSGITAGRFGRTLVLTFGAVLLAVRVSRSPAAVPDTADGAPGETDGRRDARLRRKARAQGSAVLGVLVVLFGAAPARGAATWLTPAITSAPGCECGAPTAATDATGDLTVAYLDEMHGMMVARHPAGGMWSSPVQIGPSANPVLAGNGAGDGVLAYVYQGDVDAIVDAAGEPWPAAAASTLSTAGAQTAPSVAIDAQGDALVAWETPAGEIDVAYRPVGSAWNPAIPLDDQAVGNVAPSVAFTPGGAATIVWASDNGSDEAVVSAMMNADGSWTSPVQIATDKYFYTVQVALDSHADATAAWTGYDGTNYLLGTADRPAGGAWHADGNLATGGQSNGPSPNSGFGLAVNAAGKAALVWAFGVNDPVSIAAAVRPAGGVWGSSTVLATVPSPDFMQDLQAVVATDGTVTADWSFNDDGALSAAVWADQDPPDGTWNTPNAISPPIADDSGGVTLVDPAGDVDVLAVLFNGTAYPVWSMVNDGGGPVLEGLVVPARGTVGVPVDFAVTPLDAWSAIFATHWSFGDGTTATDESVSHAYTAPGTYTLTTSSSDILGNTTSQSSTIVITPAPTTSIPPASTPTSRLTLRVTQAHRRWREPTRWAAPRVAPVDTHFGLTVNEAARVTLTFWQAIRGRRLHDHCRTINPTDRNDPRCVRNALRGKLSLRITAAGRRRLEFTGWLGARRLGLGPYTVTIRATGAGGTATSRLSFTITN